MSQRFSRLLILILIALALPMFVWLALPQPQAAAQCGTTASSCKTCHEIQGKLRVSTNGDWHIQHSFGDFCVFCHAGDAKATDKTKAHKSMVKPLENVSASCAACHEADCNTRAERYARILGVTAGMGNGGPAAPRGPAPLLPFVPRVAGVGGQAALPGQDQSPIAESSPPSSDAQEPRNINWGNVTLAALALVLLFGGGGYALWNERQLAGRSTWDKLIGNRPELGALMPLLAEADPQTVQVITRTLAERSK
jgi:cytochrome c553